ncbi:Unannotated [Lentimonas sp. CC19]|nr:Unannotated [Lentimonas sp. CC10]CAA6693752.1 Unannotated [Lentimonas sp. CC19]CAA7070122.1 Unannotated [Lentimonas sp. CC11]
MGGADQCDYTVIFYNRVARARGDLGGLCNQVRRFDGVEVHFSGTFKICSDWLECGVIQSNCSAEASRAGNRLFPLVDAYF